MGDGYHSEGSTLICTDSFTKQDDASQERLIQVLGNKFGIKAPGTLKRRISENGVVT